ncbi:MAG: hypothetical protein V3W41_08995 [Planctomycetota bacterium]
MNAKTNETAAKKASPKPKKKKEQAKVPTAITTLADLTLAYPPHLTAIGKSESTASSYRGDLKVAAKHFGETTKISALTERKVKAYFESDLVTKTRKGEPKNPITTAKLCRVFRLGLVWLAEEGHLAEAPIPGDDISRQKKSE